MMRTLLQALRDEVGFPVSEGFLTNRLLARGLCPSGEATAGVLRSVGFLGAKADALVGIVQMPNITEGDYKVELTNRGELIKAANHLYRSIGEPEVDEKPKAQVVVGW